MRKTIGENEAMEPALRSEYAEALGMFIATASDDALARAQEIGTASLHAGLDSSAVAVAHFAALAAGDSSNEIAGETANERSSRFLAEALRPFSVARRRLEQMSEELAMMNDALVERTRALEIANSEIEAFSYSISHDLRTSLQAVLGFAQTLAARHSQELGPEALRCIELISKGAEGMNELVDDLLALAQAKRLPLECESIDLASLVREAIGELEPQLAASDADLVVNELPVVEADRVLLKRVFVNLISNAIKYSREAKPRARVEVGSSRRGEMHVLFVRDNGVGFDMCESERLFRAFERLHRSGEYEGTGVGLALVARIVDRHGGYVWAESEPGKGATFYFALPDAAAHATPSPGERTASDDQDALSG